MSDLLPIFEQIASRFDSDTMAGVTASVQFSLTGDDGANYYLAINEGELSYGAGATDNPDATVTMEAEDFKAMTSGELNPMMAFMGGKIKVDGDMSTVMKFQSLLSG